MSLFYCYNREFNAVLQWERRY